MSSVSNITSLPAVQTASIQQSVAMPIATAATSSTAHITIPPGSVLARSQTGQLLIVNNSSINSQQQNVYASTNAIKTVATIAQKQSQSNTVSSVKIVTTTTASISNTTNKPNAVSTASPTTTSTVSLSQDDIVNVSKCRNFLTTLIKLASTGGQSPSTVSNVKKLVQNLIDNKIQPEHFTQQLQVELNSAPQPYLVPFLKRSLPLLRMTMLQQNTPQTSTTVTSQPQVRLPITDTGGGKLQMNAVRRTVAAGIKANPILKNTVPDIKLPRYSSSPTPQRADVRFSSISHQGIHRSPHGINRNANQKWSAANATTGGGTFKDDDDINDVASMAGVNLSEESARISATNSTVIGSQVRSCSDNAVLQSNVLINKIKQVVSKHPRIQKLGVDFDKYLALAVETRLKDVLEKVSLVAYHRTINFKESNHYTACQDVKSQLKFLLQLDQIERKRHEEMERAVLLRAIKSRSKNEDPEQLRLKQKAKEMQQAEMEKLQIRNADETARIAIGPRKKKPKLTAASGTTANGEPEYAVLTSSSSSRQSLLKPRLKRVNLRDLLFVLETEKEFCKSNTLYSSYLK